MTAPCRREILWQRWCSPGCPDSPEKCVGGRRRISSLSWLAGAARDYPAGHSFAMLALLEELWPTTELVVTAQNPPEELRIFLQENPHLELTALVKTPESADALAALAPFTKDYPILAQGARYYLCRAGPVPSL